MSMFLHSEQEFEQGTTVSSRIRLTDQNGDYVQADSTLNFDQTSSVEDVQMEITDPETEEVIRTEEYMQALTDDNGDRYYLDTWETAESLQPKEYYMIHRAMVDGEPFKLTRIVEVVEVKDNC